MHGHTERRSSVQTFSLIPYVVRTTRHFYLASAVVGDWLMAETMKLTDRKVPFILITIVNFVVVVLNHNHESLRRCSKSSPFSISLVMDYCYHNNYQASKCFS